MSLSKYPNQLDLFETKKDAQFDGDPNGDFVMADDVNTLQDAISAIETSLGVNPQGNKLSVGERITLLEGSSALRAPSFLIYLGKPALINDSQTTLEAAGWFSKFDHVVLGNNAMDPNDPDHTVTLEIINMAKMSKDAKFYGYIDCGVNTFNLSISELQNQIIEWKDLGVVGIYCANFGFEDRVTRERQNQILDSIHQYGLVAILDTVDPEQAFTNIYHETMNPNWIEPNIEDGDIYHYNSFALDSSIANVYEANQIGAIQKLIKLYDYRVNKGIKIFATPVIQTTVNQTLAQQYYDYAHTTALVTSMDAFYPVTEGYAELTHKVPVYDWMPIAGSWYMASPRIEYDLSTGVAVRETPFGRIILDMFQHTYKYEGLYIPFEALRIALNSIEGNLLKDGTIEDKKIQSYDGQRLIGAINADESTDTIDISKVSVFGYDSINGNIPTDVLRVNVIDAINAHIGNAVIDQAFIGELNASHITAGTIEAGRITASVVDAINLYAQNAEIGHAVIGEAVIGNLSAEKITAGSIDAERIKAGVIEAINLSADQANIKNLNADNIVAGNIKAERIQAEVVNALNLYSENMVVGSAVINSASVGELTAGHIKGSVIEAVNLSADSATIGSAKIGALTADHIKGTVIEAINASIESAVIDQAQIGDLSATKITAGTIDADRIKSSVVEAINLSTENATIENAKIGNLSADKITAGDINAERLKAAVVDAINLHAETMTADSATISNATIGALESKHIKGAVVEAINLSAETATIANAKIGNLSVDNMKAAVIAAVNASIESAVIDQANIGNLDAEKITAGNINADRLKAGVVEAINLSTDTATIGSAKIGQLEVDNMKAAVISAVNASIENATIDAAAIGSLKAANIQAEVIKAINASIETAVIDSAQIGNLTSDHIKGAVVEAINLSAETATIANAKIGQLSVDNMKGTVIEAVNSYTGTAVIGEAKIGNLSADKITSGDIHAERITAGVIDAVNAHIGEATIDKAVIPQLDAGHIQAQVIAAINASIETATIDAAQIGSLNVENMSANIIKAVNASLETATIDSAQIGTMTADHIKGAVIEALNFNAQTATIDEALIGSLNAGKINAGDISSERMSTYAITAVNANLSGATIDSAKIGALTADKIEASVINAINANIGEAHIDKAIIPELDAAHIQSQVVDAINANIAGTAKINSAVIGTITADKISTNVIEAINANIGSATINKAVIPTLDAGHIKASVVDAINLSTTTAQIDQGRIGNLDAGKITAGDISADRMKANAISAINADLTSATIGSAKIGTLKAENIQAEVIKAINASIETATIDAANIGSLKAENIQAEVIKAINASIETATIDSANIGVLAADRIQASVIAAINANIGSATINEAMITSLNAGKIQGGQITADVMRANAISAINASLESATINSAKIGNITSDKIEASVIAAVNANIGTATINKAVIPTLDAGHIQASVIGAINANIGSATINKAIIPQLDAEHIETQVIAAINANIGIANIDQAVIPVLSSQHIEASVIDAINTQITGRAVINEASIGALSATKITSGDISADRMKTNAIAAINADITSATIDSAQIGSLKAENIQAEVIKAINASLESATIDAAQIGTLAVDNISANVIKAINASLESVTIGSAKIGTLSADNMKAAIIDAINLTTQSAVIGEGKIANLSAGKITTGDIAAARMTTNAIAAINADITTATIDSAQIGTLAADRIQANVISAINANIGSATINKAIIPQLDATHIQATVVEAINAKIGSAKIDSAAIGTIDASNIATNVISAINANIGVATINKAVIPTLDATHIQTNVIDAINATVSGRAVINQAQIGALDATKIATGDLAADRMKTNAISAINADLTSAKIGNAKIGNLTAGHIQAVAIEAINARLDNVTINAGKIGALEVDNLKASVIEAINASIENATINSAMIGTLAADKIQTNVIAAINANIGSATIDQAIIPNLTATKITAGDIAAARMTTNAIAAINADLTTATIDAAQIGSLTASNIKAEVIAAINASIETATIDAANIGTLKAENMQTEILKAINASVEVAKISQAQIGNLDATKITAGDINAARLTANVVSAINADVQTAQIAEAKIGNLTATKITAGDIAAARLQANVVSAINTYTQNMTVGSAKINSAVMGTLAVDHMQAAVISAINASIEQINGNNAVINNAKIGTLTTEHIKSSVVEAINLGATSAVINQAKIGNLDATKITAGDIATDRLKANAISAVNADLSSATINAAKIGTLKAENIQAEVIKAINASIETALIDSANITALDANHIKASVITAINASVENITIDNGKIGTLDADHIKAAVITAINASVENIKINNAMIDVLTADHIKAQVVEAINLAATSATINAAKIGVLEATNIKAGSIDATKISVAGLRADQITSGYISAQRLSANIITSDLIQAGAVETKHIATGTLKGDRIEAGTISGDRIVAGTLDASFIRAGTITSELIAAGGITARNIAAGSITADQIQAGSISAEHISTKGLDAQSIQVYNGKTGEVLIGSGYLRVDGLDVGVVQSDNLVANGAFMTSSSAYGYLRNNPEGEAILGGKSTAPGGHQLWKINIADGTVFPIDLGAKKPVDVAIDTNGTFGYVTMQGNDTLVQVDLINNTRTGLTLPMGKGPGRIYFNGDTLMDMKHFMVLNTDPDDVNLPDALMVVDAPPSSIDQALYVHHEIPLGNMPYDIVTSSRHQSFVTLADQGDIAMLEMSHPNSMNWKPVRNIPISAYMTDNYHGGLPGDVGLNEVTGGDSAAQYDTQMEEMNMPSHNHGGYGVTDGSLMRYEPHGLSLSFDPGLLYVADYANGHLVIVDINGKAPYNALTGSRQQGNLGTMGYPANMGPNKPENPPTGTAPTAPTVGGDASMGGMIMSIEEATFEVKMDGMDMGGEVTNGAGRTFSKDPLQHTTQYVWYRIPVGDSPEFVVRANGYIFVTVEGTGKVAVIKEQDIIDNITHDRWYYTNYDEFTEMYSLPTWSVTQINVGSKPSHMQYCETTKRLFVTVNGQNQVVIIDTTAIDPMTPDASIVQRVNVGANPKGIAIDTNGEFMYVVNHGGTGNLSFVYPDTADYIGDPYVGLEGGVEYQGADGWVPNRSNWTERDGEVVAAAAVEFHINEPFLNEGGYVKLTAYNDGQDAQYSLIEQDIVNVVNYSNGDNIRSVVGEVLTANEILTLFTPNNPWMQEYGVTNVKIKGQVKNETLVRGGDNRTFTAANKWLQSPQKPSFIKVLADGTELVVAESSYVITYPTTDAGVAKIVFNAQVETGANIIATSYYWWKTATGYTVEYNTGAYIRFNLGVIQQDEWVEADYTHRYNMWFKPHNGSIAIAVENDSSDNFYTKFEIDEFVPKFVTYDNQQTEPFVYSPIVNAGTNKDYDGIEYSMITNRALGAYVTSTTASSVDLGVDSSPDLRPVVDGKEPADTNEENGEHMMPMSVGEPVFNIMHSMGTEVLMPPGLQNVIVDLGKTYMIGHLVIMHSFHKKRKYHATKTEVSADGITWTTVFNSAVSGEYYEYTEDPVTLYRMYGNHITFNARPIRYIRDWANGYAEYDATWANPVEYTDNYWTEIKAYGDWEFDTSYMYPESAPNPGEAMATNGEGLVTTDIAGAWAAIDIPIDFTSKWYMTYLIGPEFGMADVEMSSMMGMTHSLTMDAPNLSKFQHKHIMYWPPSTNVKDNPMIGVKAGKHRATIRQKSGRINIDRFRFEDFQYFDRNFHAITADKSATFRREKIVPNLAQWYKGDAVQSSEGAYDSPRLNPDTGQPDYSVAIKYRMRFRVDLAAGAQLPDGTRKPGKGIAYATSAIFETGKLSSHWRMSQSSDMFPGTRIEAWDANHPHKTGIQNFHLANGSVTGNKIKPLSMMDHHISPYAKISESKLLLNHPTHRHGQPIMVEAMPGMFMEVGFVPNNATLDTITGWGTSGTSTNMARADHNHDDIYVLKEGDGSVASLTVTGDITIGGLVDGVDVSQLDDDFDTHIADMVAHLTTTEHTKLTGISTGAKKTETSTTNGNIKIDGVESNVYTHPATDGNLHVPATSTSNNGKFLKAGATAGSLSWQQVAFTDISGSITAAQHGNQTSGTLHANATQAVNGFMSSVDKTKLDGVSTGATKTIASATNGYALIDGVDTKIYAHPTGDGNLHVPANGTGNANKVLKASSSAGVYSWSSVLWNEISGTFSDANHGNLSGGALHAAVTQSVNGFMIAADKAKLDGIQSGAINQTTADGRYLRLSGGTVTGNLVIDSVNATSGIEIGDMSLAETPYIDFHSSGTGNDYDARIIASGGNATIGKGTLTVEASTFAVNGDITTTGKVDGVDISIFKSSYDTHTKVPNPATTLALTEDGAVMDVRFALSDSGEVTDYEIWASFGDTTNYEIVGMVNKADIAGGTTTYTFVDDSYNRKGTIYYRVYAKNGSVRSSALEGSTTMLNTVADPTNLQVVANVDSFDIYYTVPQDRRLAYVEVVIDKQAVEANLSEASAVVVYSGLADRYTYKIPSIDYDKFHNVWVRSVTRT